MWRACFLAAGITLVIVGVECLGVETINLKTRDDPAPAAFPLDTPATTGPLKKVTPPEWAPWSLISTGVVVCLYSFTIPARFKEKG